MISEYGDALAGSSLSAQIGRRHATALGLAERTDALQAIRGMRSWAKLRLSPYEAYLGEWTEVSQILADGKPVPWSVGREGGKVTYHVQAILPARYELRLKKEGYLDAVLDMRSQIAESPDAVEELDLGNVNMLSRQQQLKVTLTWGRLPLDLDAHVFCFDGALNDAWHANFLDLEPEGSGIRIDADDTSSYGPETVRVFPLDRGKYYLFTVHNYSRYVFPDGGNSDMDPEGMLRVRVQLYGFTLDVRPKASLKGKYWWDALVVHDGAVHVINSAPDDRWIDYSHGLSMEAKRRLLELVRGCDETYPISGHMPSSMRWWG